MTDDLITDPDFAPTKPNPWPFRFWVAVTLVAAGFLLTDLVVSGGGAGGLVIDWKLGPAFIAVLGGIWGARKARRALIAANAEDDRLAAAEARELLREVARDRAHGLASGPTEGEPADDGPPTSGAGF